MKSLNLIFGGFHILCHSIFRDFWLMSFIIHNVSGAGLRLITINTSTMIYYSAFALTFIVFSVELRRIANSSITLLSYLGGGGRPAPYSA